MCRGAGWSWTFAYVCEGSLQSAVGAPSRAMASTGAAAGITAVFWACRAPGSAPGGRIRPAGSRMPPRTVAGAHRARRAATGPLSAAAPTASARPRVEILPTTHHSTTRAARKSYNKMKGSATMLDDTTPKDIKFLDSLTAEQMEPCRGEWVAIYDGGIVAHGKDPGRVARAAHNAGVRSPLMEYFFAGPSEVPFQYMVPP